MTTLGCHSMQHNILGQSSLAEIIVYICYAHEVIDNAMASLEDGHNCREEIRHKVMTAAGIPTPISTPFYATKKEEAASKS